MRLSPLAQTVDLAGVVIETYGVDTYQVNLLPVSYGAVYLPVSILSLWWMERYGMRSSMGLSVAALLVTAWMRYGGALLGLTDTGKAGGWALIMAGTWIAALGQPFVLNVAARLSMDWFPAHERDLATVIGTMANACGQLLGSLLPAYAVVVGADMPKYSLDQAIFSTVLFLAVIALFRDRPATAPSAEAAIQWTERDRLVAENPTALSRMALQTMWKDAKSMWANRNFRWLAVSMPLAVGAVWALLTVQWSLITPCGYDAVTSGTAGAVSIGVGVITAFLITPVMARLKAFVPLQRGFTLFALAAGLFVFGGNQPGSSGAVIASWATTGAAVQPLLPISLEHAAEQTFPIPPDSSTAILLSLTNVYYLIITYVMTALLTYDVSLTCSSIVTPTAGFYIAVLLIALLAVVPLKADYKRSAVLQSDHVAQEASMKVKALEEGAGDSDASLKGTEGQSTAVAVHMSPTKPEAEVEGGVVATAEGAPRRRSSVTAADAHVPSV